MLDTIGDGVDVDDSYDNLETMTATTAMQIAMPKRIAAVTTMPYLVPYGVNWLRNALRRFELRLWEMCQEAPLLENMMTA